MIMLITEIRIMLSWPGTFFEVAQPDPSTSSAVPLGNIIVLPNSAANLAVQSS